MPINSSASVAAWPAEIDEILGGDQVVAMAQITPASGVVVTPLTNFGIRDPLTGTATPLNSSIGMWKKLRSLQHNPRVAIAYHTRMHGFSERPEYVLLQGTVTLSPLQDRAWLERHRANWERFAGPRDAGPLWERWLRFYHWRVGIQIEVERVLAWPDLACRGPVRVYGAPLPSDPPPPQRAPTGGSTPRVDQRRAAGKAARLPNVLLGWVGSDGLPLVVPVDIAGSDSRGIALTAPAGMVPPGGRRAGLTAHTFARYTYGQRQRRHSGWLQADPDQPQLIYAPHTEHGYYLPASRTLFRLSAGAATRRGYRAGLRDGFLRS
jgi:hypothetical protein